MDEMEKRQLINDVDTVANVEMTKRFKDAIPVARAYDFFNILKELERKRLHLTNYKTTLIKKIIKNLSKYDEDLLKKKLRQWLLKAITIRDNAVKNRIAKWTEERFRISNARKNWKKLSDLLDLYTQKKPLYELRKKLIRFMTLNDLADKLRDRFTKTGNDQFKEGVKYIITLKYLKKLFEDVDDINRQILLKQYLNKWNKIAKKLKKRDDKLRDAMDEMEKRQLINDVNIVSDVMIIKRFKEAVPVARVFDFFDKLKDTYTRRNKFEEVKTNILIRIIDKAGKYSEDYLRKILKKWLLTAEKIRDETVKNRIAKWTEERYRISNARKNWKKLSDLLDLYDQKRPLFELRKKLIKYMRLNDLADKLRERFAKTGIDQFKEGVKYIINLKYLKKLFEDFDDINLTIFIQIFI